MVRTTDTAGNWKVSCCALTKNCIYLSNVLDCCFHSRILLHICESCKVMVKFWRAYLPMTKACQINSPGARKVYLHPRPQGSSCSRFFWNFMPSRLRKWNVPRKKLVCTVNFADQNDQNISDIVVYRQLKYFNPYLVVHDSKKWYKFLINDFLHEFYLFFAEFVEVSKNC